MYCLVVPGKGVIRRQTKQVRSNWRNCPRIVLLTDNPKSPVGLSVVPDPIYSRYEVLACWSSVELGLNIVIRKNRGQGVEVPI
jgi:hypothetical protein